MLMLLLQDVLLTAFVSSTAARQLGLLLFNCLFPCYAVGFVVVGLRADCKLRESAAE